MAETLDWVFYDSVTSGTTANADVVFFTQSESGTNKQTTNLPVAGKMTESESFVVNEIILFYETDTEFDDLLQMNDRTVTEFLINNNRWLILPSAMLAPASYINMEQDSIPQSAVTSVGGIKGRGFKLEHPIMIPAGAPFKVVWTHGNAAAGTASDLKVCLKGILTRK